jgi:hypothetical protein
LATFLHGTMSSTAGSGDDGGALGSPERRPRSSWHTRDPECCISLLYPLHLIDVADRFVPRARRVLQGK